MLSNGFTSARKPNREWLQHKTQKDGPQREPTSYSREPVPTTGSVRNMARAQAKQWAHINCGPRYGIMRVSLLLRLQRRAQLVGECAEALGGRSIALRPLAHFLGLARFHDCLRAQADAPA